MNATTKNQKKIFRSVQNTLRTVGLKATIDGRILTVAPFGKTRTFDLSDPIQMKAWRHFYFAARAHAQRKCEKELRAAKCRIRERGAARLARLEFAAPGTY